MRFISLLVFVLVFLWGAAAQATIWQVQQFQPFVYHYHPQDSKNLPGVIRALNTEYPVIGERLGIEPLESASVFIAPTLQDFQQLSGAQLPMWVGGYAIPEAQMMVLKSPTFGQPIRDLNTTAVHELVHLQLES